MLLDDSERQRGKYDEGDTTGRTADFRFGVNGNGLVCRWRGGAKKVISEHRHGAACCRIRRRRPKMTLTLDF